MANSRTFPRRLGERRANGPAWRDARRCRANHHGGGHVAGLDEAFHAPVAGQAGAARHDHGMWASSSPGPQAALAHDAVAVLALAHRGRGRGTVRMTSVSSSMPSVRMLFMRCPNHFVHHRHLFVQGADVFQFAVGVQAVDMA